MTLIEKIKFLREERFHDLNYWAQGFVEDIYTLCTENDPTPEEVEEFLTIRQKEKIYEIWEDAGL